jgi:ATP-dependent DNA helicase RecQ
MLDFIVEDVECRSVIIGNYFGDTKMRSCGICDNCLRKKHLEFSKEEFEMISHRIINIVKYEPLDPKELFAKLNGLNKEKTWKVLDFLQSENKVEIDTNGRVRLR